MNKISKYVRRACPLMIPNSVCPCHFRMGHEDDSPTGKDTLCITPSSERTLRLVPPFPFL